MKLIKIISVLLLVLGLLLCGVSCGDEEVTYSQMDYMTEDLTPYVTLGQYKNLTLTADPISISDQDVEKTLQSLVDSKTEYVEYEEPVTDRPTEAGDYLLIDFAGYMEGELFEGGTAEDANILLAEESGYIDWFDDDLYGVMPGTVVETTNCFPENYYEDFAGKEVTFKITVKAIVGHYTVPELTDEFVKSITGCESVEAYRELVRATLLERATQAANTERYQIMWKAIMENATIHSLPEEQVMFYYTSNRSYLEATAEEYEYTYEEYLEACGVDDAYVKTMAEDRVREELIFYSVVKAENLNISDEEYAAGVEAYAEANGVSVEELEEQYGKEYIADSLLWDEMIYTLFETVTFVSE